MKMCEKCWVFKSIGKKCWYFWEGKKSCSQFKEGAQDEPSYAEEGLI